MTVEIVLPLAAGRWSPPSWGMKTAALLFAALALGCAAPAAPEVEEAPVGTAASAGNPHCISSHDCPSGPPDSCLGAFCDHTGTMPGDAGDGCYIATVQAGAPCWIGGVQQVCSTVHPGDTVTKCCPPTGPCP